jgi:hypothetical protein
VRGWVVPDDDGCGCIIELRWLRCGFVFVDHGFQCIVP